MLLKYLTPLIYADEMSTTLSSMLSKCLQPLIYTDEMPKTLSSMLLKSMIYIKLVKKDHVGDLLGKAHNNVGKKNKHLISLFLLLQQLLQLLLLLLLLLVVLFTTTSSTTATTTTSITVCRVYRFQSG